MADHRNPTIGEITTASEWLTDFAARYKISREELLRAIMLRWQAQSIRK